MNIRNILEISSQLKSTLPHTDILLFLLLNKMNAFKANHLIDAIFKFQFVFLKIQALLLRCVFAYW